MAGFFSRPMTSGADDYPVGMDELGNVIYSTPMGDTYTVKMQPAPRESVLKGAWNAMREDPLGFGGNVLRGMAEGVWQGVSAPGRAAAGEPVTYGDVAATAMDWALPQVPGLGAKYDPTQVNAGAVKAWHGSPAEGIETLRASRGDHGALGPGVYFTPNPGLAKRYGPNVYEKDLDGFFGGLGRLDSDADVNYFQTWRDETAKLLDAATDSERKIIEDSLTRLGAGDGYSLLLDLARGLGSKEAAQDVFRRAGFKGLSGHVDGPEIVMFDDVPLRPSIRAYHGSPHDFDKFSLDHIGTGEGAQAYGHGLYFAEAEDTARFYRDNYAKPDRSQFKTDTARQLAQDQLQSWAGDIEGGISDLKASLGNEKLGRMFGDANEARIADLEDAISYMERGAPKGKMYEVNINADPDDFLDWDAPLSEQPQRVSEALQSAGFTPERTVEDLRGEALSALEKMRGVDAAPWVSDAIEEIASEVSAAQSPSGVYLAMKDIPSAFGLGDAPMWGGVKDDVANAISRLKDAGDPRAPDNYKLQRQMETVFDGPESAASALRQSGIPGIKYKDGMSRGADGGTRNYVVFDDSLIDIVRKYGWAGLAPLGINALSQEQQY